MTLAASLLTSRSAARPCVCTRGSATSRVLSRRTASSLSCFFGRRTLHMSQTLRHHARGV